jgi:hypothetical protein
MRDVASLAKAARRHGDAIGVYAERRSIPAAQARAPVPPRPGGCRVRPRAGSGVVNVTKIASMLEKATGNTLPPPRPAVAAARFARDPAEYAPRARQRNLIPGGRRVPDEPDPGDQVSPDLRKTLRTLKVGQMLDTLPERLAPARQHGPRQFLELVLAGEITRREAKSASLRARAAGLDAGIRLDTWDETAAVRYDHQLWNELASLRFLKILGTRTELANNVCGIWTHEIHRAVGRPW